MTPRRATPATSTFIKRLILAAVLAAACLAAVPGESASENPETFLERASRLLRDRDRRGADFWFARYLGAVTSEPLSDAASEFLLDRRLDPKVFTTPNPDSAYLEWMERTNREQWSPADPRQVREAQRSVEIASSAQDRYRASVVAYPEIQRWYATQGPNVLRQLVLAVGRIDRRPVLFVAGESGGQPRYLRPIVLYEQTAMLLYARAPEFHDADGDGVPEVWVRYALLWHDGPAEALSVYRIGAERPELVRQFLAGTGGLVRRLGDGTVEINRSAENGRFLRESWACSDGEFQLLGQESLETAEWRGDGWRDYL